MKHQTTIVLAIILFSACATAAFGEKPVKLYKEETTIVIENNSFSVRGLYFFENRSDFELDVTITYPFFVDVSQSFPDEIELLDPGQPIEFEKKENTIQWSQHFEPSGIETVFVAYTQKIEKKKARYILKKKFWNEKVDKTHIAIEAPLEWTNIALSIEPDSSRTDEHKRYFYLTKRYFLAKSDLIITWE